MYTNHRQRDFFWGALIGCSVATLSTLLFTTKKGKQIRNQVVEKCGHIEDSIHNALSDAKEKLEEPALHAEKKIAHKIKHEDHPQGAK